MNPSYCGQQWDFFTIKNLAALTTAEQNEFEIKIAFNFLKKTVGIQECPVCKTFCERMDKKEVRVVCTICTGKEGKLFEFCWYCLRKWLTQNYHECGNANCSGEDPRKRILRECIEKTVSGLICPAIRACPKCGIMIEHNDGCNNMQCPHNMII